MRVVAYGQTDVGRVRDHNEDAYLLDEALGLYIVCDGMGGHAAGEVASQEAIRIIQETIRDNQTILQGYRQAPGAEHRAHVLRLVETAVKAANTHVHSLAQNDEDKKGMGTTLALLLTLDAAAIVAHVGDSRVYLLRAEQAHQLTEDHSLAAGLLKSGVLSKDEVAHGPFANVITRCIGQKPTVDVETMFIECMPSDRFLLCSDGLHNYLSDAQELLHISPPQPLEALPQECVALANYRGGHDNVTALAVEVVEVQTTAAEAGIPVARKVEALRHIRLFRLCNDHELVKLLNIVQVCAYNEGDTILEEGMDGDDFFILVSGKAQVHSQGQYAWTLHPGSSFGESGLLERTKRAATVVAQTPVKAMRIRQHDFYALLEQEHTMAVKLLKSFLQVMHQRVLLANTIALGARETATAASQELRVSADLPAFTIKPPRLS